MKAVGGIICAECGIPTPKRGNGPQKYCVPCSEAKCAERQRKWARSNPAEPEKQRGWANKRKSVARARGEEVSAAAASGPIEFVPPLPNAAWYCGLSMPFSQAASKNHMWTLAKGGHIFKSGQSRAWRAQLTALIAAKRPVGLKQNKLWLDIFVQKPHHRGDAVNMVDLICDAVKDGLGLDDRWFCIRRVDWEICKKDPVIWIGMSQDNDAEDAQACSHCGRILAFQHFGKKSGNKSGHDRVCRECRTGKPLDLPRYDMEEVEDD